jgi:hypothetical protein
MGDKLKFFDFVCACAAKAISNIKQVIAVFINLHFDLQPKLL